MANFGGARTGAGRPKGSQNRHTVEAERFVERCEKRLRKGKKFQGLEGVAIALLESGEPAAMSKVLIHLLQMRYGKPRQAVEVSGPEGEAISAVEIVLVGAKSE